MKKTKNKILMLVENNYPEDTRVKREAVTLAQAGYGVSVVALRWQQQPWQEMIDGVQVYRIPQLTLFQKGYNQKQSLAAKFIHNLKTVVGYLVEYFYFTFASFAMSLYVLFRQGFDAVHAHNPPDTLFLIGAFYRLFGKKFVFDHHDVSPELFLSRYGKKGGLIYRGLMLIEKLSFRAANTVIATNESYKKIAVQRGRKKPEDVFIVRNGPDLTRFKPVAPDEMLEKMNKTILGYVGEMGPQDGLDYLLRAIRHLVYDLGRTDFYCVIIGAGDAFDDLQKLKRELRIENYVRFTGIIPFDDLLRYLSTADICVDPDPSSPLNDVSTWIKIMEYMALKKPIVTFDLAETRFSAQNAAVYVKPNDEMEFARAIEKLMDDPGLRAELGANGYQRVKSELSWQHVSKNLLQAYDALFKKMPQSTPAVLRKSEYAT